jgi:hypothetical protein
VNPPFPEIDYVADEEGIFTSIKLEAEANKKIDPDVPVVNNENMLGNEEKKLDLCCRQADNFCLSKMMTFESRIDIKE